MIIYEQIRKRLSAEIKQSGMTQAEIAKKIGVGQQQISKYLTSETMPSLDVFSNICKVLDVDTNYILCLD